MAKSPELTPQLSEKTETLLKHVQELLGLDKGARRRLRERLWNFSSCVRQPDKRYADCNKTPHFNRWDTRAECSHITPSDPRYATQEECEHVYATLLALLLEAHKLHRPLPEGIRLAQDVLGRDLKYESLTCVRTGQPICASDIKRALGYTTYGLAGYEIPTSYRVDLSAGGRHEHRNVGWMKPLHLNYALRTQLKKAGVPKKAFEKIQVKSYCTDKQTMPPYFSNRDVRWVTWPSSPQYATHYECALVEMELMLQLYEFADAPEIGGGAAEEARQRRAQPVETGTRRCLITGRLLSFVEFVEATVNPEGGKSDHHVGHMEPLTKGGAHSAKNIAWLSDAGNRIQGNDTVAEIEVILFDAVEYYLRRDLQLKEPPEEFHLRVARLQRLIREIIARQG